MIFLRSILEVADNTGARKAAMIARKGQGPCGPADHPSEGSRKSTAK